VQQNKPQTPDFSTWNTHYCTQDHYCI